MVAPKVSTSASSSPERRMYLSTSSPFRVRPKGSFSTAIAIPPFFLPPPGEAYFSKHIVLYPAGKNKRKLLTFSPADILLLSQYPKLLTPPPTSPP